MDHIHFTRGETRCAHQNDCEPRTTNHHRRAYVGIRAANGGHQRQTCPRMPAVVPLVTRPRWVGRSRRQQSSCSINIIVADKDLAALMRRVAHGKNHSSAPAGASMLGFFSATGRPLDPPPRKTPQSRGKNGYLTPLRGASSGSYALSRIKVGPPGSLPPLVTPPAPPLAAFTTTTTIPHPRPHYLKARPHPLPIRVHGKRVPLEVALLLRVAHIPQVVRLLNWLEKDDSFLLILERPEPCKDLYEYVTERGPLPEDEARNLMLQVVNIVRGVSCGGRDPPRHQGREPPGHHRQTRPTNFKDLVGSLLQRVAQLGVGYGELHLVFYRYDIGASLKDKTRGTASPRWRIRYRQTKQRRGSKLE
ncbi:Serine/threonine-protein kinase pim-1 [Chionoecetes opilio]|uniref:non-specific serine/threonine protein kinase n=1 Tax=Chionoecetes opilio TaxID=41210 RepID=A0A8J5CF27_CHIOP|nr:Serine/threonine-protein kinase pim-1 [Chionoecetes opilio]